MIALSTRLHGLRRRAALIGVLVTLAFAVLWAHGGMGMDHMATAQAAGVCLAVVEGAVALGFTRAGRTTVLHASRGVGDRHDLGRPLLPSRPLPFARAGPARLQVFRC